LSRAPSPEKTHIAEWRQTGGFADAMLAAYIADDRLRPGLDLELLNSDHLSVAPLELVVGLKRLWKERSRRAIAAASRGALLSPMAVGMRLSRFVEAAWRQAALTARAAWTSFSGSMLSTNARAADRLLVVGTNSPGSIVAAMRRRTLASIKCPEHDPSAMRRPAMKSFGASIGT
jgi:hypothetical protein